MRVCAIAGILFSLIFVASNESVRASDANEIQKIMANALRQQATALANQGLLEQAETFLRAAKQIEMNLEGHGVVGSHLSLAGVTDEPQIMKRLQDLLDKRRRLKQVDAPEAELNEVQEQITDIKNELKAALARRTGRAEHSTQARAAAEPLGTATRIDHLHAAVQHLQHAEAHDLARQAKEMYDRVKSEWVEELRQKRDAISQRPHTGDQGPDQMQAMRAEIKKTHSEIEQLRAEVKALRQQVQER